VLRPSRLAATARAPARRSGPPNEDRWWDPRDQVLAEAAAVARRDLPRRAWKRRLLINNAEVLDQFVGVPGGERLVRIADERERTALDEGVAFAGSEHQLVVSRLEVFATPDAGAHRDAWRQDAPTAMAALYRQRWHERGRAPGWVEGAWADIDWPLDERVDWLRVQDHTDRRDESGLFLFEHLHLWAGRALAAVTVRHPPTVEVDSLAAHLADRVLHRLQPFA